MSVESEDPGLPSDPGFAPKDLTDARLPGQWRSRYEASAWKWILAEGVNLVLFLVVVVCSLVIIWLRHPAAWWQLSPQQSETFTSVCIRMAWWNTGWSPFRDEVAIPLRRQETLAP